MDMQNASKALLGLLNAVFDLVTLAVRWSTSPDGLLAWLVALLLGILVFKRISQRREHRTIKLFKATVKNEPAANITLATELSHILAVEVQEAFNLCCDFRSPTSRRSFDLSSITIEETKIRLSYRDPSTPEKAKLRRFQKASYQDALEANRKLSKAIHGQESAIDSSLFYTLLTKAEAQNGQLPCTWPASDLWDELLGSYDVPITIPQQDHFGFIPYAEVLSQHIEKARPPLTIGIHGAWGTGKTSLMNLVQRTLECRGTIAVVNFGAWKYSTQEALWRGLLLKLLEEIESIGNTEIASAWKEKLYYAVTQEQKGSLTINKVGVWIATTKALLIFFLLLVCGILNPAYYLLLGLANLLNAVKREKGKWAMIGIDLKNIIEQQKYTIMRRQMESLEEFKDAFEQLVSEMLMLKVGGNRFEASKHRLVIFIDDLDRCLPEVALSVLESIKLFLDIPQSIFVLGFNKELINQGVQQKFFESDTASNQDPHKPFDLGEQYVEKILQISFEMPPCDKQLVERWMISRFNNLTSDPQVANLLLKCAGDNPRKIKRICNSLQLSFDMIDKVQSQTN